MSNGTATWTYAYNNDGLRTKRTDGTDTYCYTYLDGQLSYMTINGSNIFISYDGFNNPLHITYNGAAYAYVTNLQGDVIALLDSSGTAVVQYTYDAWGKILSTTGSMAATLGKDNPLRYRGYVYDQETGLYYLQSRYYDPAIGRFINADGLVSTGQGLLGNNMFAYCLNNPVNKTDYTGNKPGDLFDSADEAARDFAMIYAQLGYENRVEYASFIYSVSVLEKRYHRIPILGFSASFSWKLGFSIGSKILGYVTVPYVVIVTKYSYVKPNKGGEDTVSVPVNWLGLRNKVAEIHNHTWIPGHINNYFSPGDLNEWVNYVSTPSGTLRKYDPNNISGELDGATAIYWDTPVDPEWRP